MLGPVGIDRLLPLDDLILRFLVVAGSAAVPIALWEGFLWWARRHLDAPE